MAVAMGLITIWWEQNHQGVKAKLAGVSYVDRFLIANRAIWFYLGKLIWPEDLSFNYPLWKIDPADPAAWFWPGLTLAAILTLVFPLFRRKGSELGDHPNRRAIITAALFYVVTLSPLLGFFMLATFKYSFVADHYQYIAAIGPFALAAAGISRGLESLTKQNTALKRVSFGVLLFVLAVLTFNQSATYANPGTLWRATIDHNPESFIAHNNLAVELLAQGRTGEAIDHYRKAFELQPDALTGQNLGHALLAVGQIDDAIFYYTKSLELEPNAPSIAFGLGNAFSLKGRVDDAIAAYRKALELQPNGPAIANALGNAYLAKGDLDNSIFYFQKSVDLAPTLARGHNNLANALIRKGRLTEAVAEYGKTIDLQPTNAIALNNLAHVLAASPDDSIRNGERALSLAQKAVELSGGNSPDFLETLSISYANLGRFPDAIAAAQKALQLPNSSSAKAGSLRAKLDLYEKQVPFRDLSLTNSPR
jgi:tetratricopeptide (TPR) repeat protein